MLREIRSLFSHRVIEKVQNIQNLTDNSSYLLHLSSNFSFLYIYIYIYIYIIKIKPNQIEAKTRTRQIELRLRHRFTGRSVQESKWLVFGNTSGEALFSCQLARSLTDMSTHCLLVTEKLTDSIDDMSLPPIFCSIPIIFCKDKK